MDQSWKACAAQMSGWSCLYSRHQVSGAAMSCAMGGGAVLDAVTAPVGAVPVQGRINVVLDSPSPKFSLKSR